MRQADVAEIVWLVDGEEYELEVLYEYIHYPEEDVSPEFEEFNFELVSAMPNTNIERIRESLEEQKSVLLELCI